MSFQEKIVKACIEATKYKAGDFVRVSFTMHGGRHKFSAIFSENFCTERAPEAFTEFESYPGNGPIQVDEDSLVVTHCDKQGDNNHGIFTIDRTDAPETPANSTQGAGVGMNATEGGKPRKWAEISQEWQDIIFRFTESVPEPPVLLYRGGVPCLWRESITVIEGGQKAGKSTTAAAMAAAAVAGGVCLGFEAREKYSVLYFCTEMSGHETRQRMTAAFSAAGEDVTQEPDPERWQLIRVRTLSLRERVERLQRITQSLNPDILIIDTATDFVPDTNDSGAARQFVDELLRLCDLTGCGLVLTIHTTTTKDNKTKPTGHTGTVLGDKDSCLMLVRNTGPVSTVSFVHGRDVGFSPFSFMRTEEGSLQLIAEENKTKAKNTQRGPAPVQVRLFEVMERGKTYQLKELVEILKDSFTRENIQKYLRISVAEGSIENAGRGLYQLANTDTPK